MEKIIKGLEKAGSRHVRGCQATEQYIVRS